MNVWKTNSRILSNLEACSSFTVFPVFFGSLVLQMSLSIVRVDKVNEMASLVPHSEKSSILETSNMAPAFDKNSVSVF